MRTNVSIHTATQDVESIEIRRTEGDNDHRWVTMSDDETTITIHYTASTIYPLIGLLDRLLAAIRDPGDIIASDKRTDQLRQ